MPYTHMPYGGREGGSELNALNYNFTFPGSFFTRKKETGPSDCALSSVRVLERTLGWVNFLPRTAEDPHKPGTHKDIDII